MNAESTHITSLFHSSQDRVEDNLVCIPPFHKGRKNKTSNKTGFNHYALGCSSHSAYHYNMHAKCE